MFGEKRKRRSLFDILGEYFEELESWIERVTESSLERPSWDERECCIEPLCNIFVGPSEVIVTADLPYAEASTVKVEPIGEDAIEIMAKMKRKVSFGDFGITYREGEFSMFRCQTRIPVPVDMERMEIRFKRGILEIHLPRRRTYRISVE